MKNLTIKEISILRALLDYVSENVDSFNNQEYLNFEISSTEIESIQEKLGEIK